MKKAVSIFSIFFVCGILILGFLIIKPVPIVAEEKAVVVQGLVVDIFEGGVKDVVFKLNDDNSSYYINRGLEYGLIIEDFKEKLVGNQVILKYPQYWTPLDWNNKIRHISKLEFNDEVLFNEFR